MKIIYFTSTGNSLYVARQFSDEPMSIIALDRAGIYSIEDDEAIGIVTPDHVSNPPRPVREYLQKVTLKAPYIFGIVTYGNDVAGTVFELSKLQKFDYINTLLMIDNYFPMFKMQQQIESAHKKEIDSHLAAIVADVNARRKYIAMPGFAIRNIVNPLMHWGFPLLGQNYKRFSVDHDKCIKCGICGNVCPMDNIDYSPWPNIGSNCLVCGACRQNCPKNAIRFKGEKDEVQYRNAHVTVKDIISAINDPIK